ncbi:TetR/AcrR family transcriptional regulator [Rhodococcus phenolicus]|uniref:TetR/AcrR family transcriptional regulator n=1 Tax=Rhodococcus phenolicus TaxID=263849 RepID=UPI00082EF967|nr:TetR/AcrR family transcriptional regulator [Rhodococcus phenolicus]
MTARRGRYSTGEETRTLLVEAAERLFAQHGYDAVTLAEIRSAAGQNNASVISYYFGSKSGLLRAVFDHRLPAIGAERDSLVRELNERKGSLTVRDALWGMVRPLADSVREGNHYVALLDRLMETDTLGTAFASADPTVTASGLAIDRTLYDTLVEIPEELRRQRIMMVYESVLRTLARFDRSGTAPGHTELAPLMDAWEGLLRAPISDETRAGLTRDGAAG